MTPTAAPSADLPDPQRPAPKRRRANLHPTLHVVPAKPDEPSGAPATQRTPLADPRPLLENLGRSVVEALGGYREVEQISRWVAPEVFTLLVQRAQHAKRARALRGLPERRPHIRTRTCLWQEVASEVVEAVVIVDLGPRVRSVAIRLERFRDRWRAERVHVL